MSKDNELSLTLEYNSFASAPIQFRDNFCHPPELLFKKFLRYENIPKYVIFSEFFYDRLFNTLARFFFDFQKLDLSLKVM